MSDSSPLAHSGIVTLGELRHQAEWSLADGCVLLRIFGTMGPKDARLVGDLQAHSAPIGLKLPGWERVRVRITGFNAPRRQFFLALLDSVEATPPRAKRNRR